MIYRKITCGVIRWQRACVVICMFNLVDPSEANVASSPTALRGRTGAKADLSAKAKPLAMKTKYDPTDWITHITRIKEDQDQAAFAELFQYFAPRVKAFLMRSGADATLAEECTQEVMATLYHNLGVNLDSQRLFDFRGRPYPMIDPGVKPLPELS